MELPSASISVVVGAGQDGHPEIMLTTNATALFVVLTTKAEGRFSDNAFLLEGSKAMTFISWALPAEIEAVAALLKSSVRVEHLAQNLKL